MHPEPSPPGELPDRAYEEVEIACRRLPPRGLARLLALAGRVPACFRAVTTGPHGRVEVARSPGFFLPRTAAASLGGDMPYGEQALGALVETLVATGWVELPRDRTGTSAASAAASVHAACPDRAGRARPAAPGRIGSRRLPRSRGLLRRAWPRPACRGTLKRVLRPAAGRPRRAARLSSRWC
jgi:hypothetical protein